MGEILSHPVQDVASQNAVTVNDGATLRDVAHQLWAANIGAAVVMRRNRPVGIISERDIVAHLAHGAKPDTFTAGEAMTPQFLIAAPTDRVLTAVIDMIDRGIRHLPLFDDAHRCVGMVSMRDLVRPMLLDALETPAATHAP